jgi:hypothetical protein
MKSQIGETREELVGLHHAETLGKKIEEAKLKAWGHRGLLKIELIGQMGQRS